MEPLTPTAVIAKRVAELRGQRGWSARELATELREAGVQWGHPDVIKLERGQRSVTVDQAVALAAVLNVGLVHLLVPPDDADAPYRVTTEVTEPSFRVRGWIRGLFPLRRLPRVGDVRQFWATVPDEEFEAMQRGQCPAPLGDPVFHLALCVGCAPVLPQPFADREDREKWVERHRAGTGHRVMLADEYSGGWLRVTYWGGR